MTSDDIDNIYTEGFMIGLEGKIEGLVNNNEYFKRIYKTGTKEHDIFSNGWSEGLKTFLTNQAKSINT